MCGDFTTIQWYRAVAKGEAPTIDRIGISYMLLGEAGADFDDISASEPPTGKGWYRVGPNIMVVFPSDAGDLTQGISHDTSRSPIRATDPQHSTTAGHPGGVGQRNTRRKTLPLTHRNPPAE